MLAGGVVGIFVLGTLVSGLILGRARIIMDMNPGGGRLAVVVRRPAQERIEDSCGSLQGQNNEQRKHCDEAEASDHGLPV